MVRRRAGDAVLGADIGKKIVVECSVSKFRGSEYVRGTVRELIAGERGGSCGLYVFHSNLLRLKEPKVNVGIEKMTAAEIRAFIEEKRKSCRYGLLVISSDGAAEEFAESLRGLETDIFDLSSQNVGNAYLVAPAADASVSGYRDVVWLDTPADCNLRELQESACSSMGRNAAMTISPRWKRLARFSRNCTPRSARKICAARAA